MGFAETKKDEGRVGQEEEGKTERLKEDKEEREILYFMSWNGFGN